MSESERFNFAFLQDLTEYLISISVERSAKALTTQSEIEVMNELPRDASDRTLKLVTMLYESAVAFLKSHSLKVNVPEETLSRAFGEGN